MIIQESSKDEFHDLTKSNSRKISWNKTQEMRLQGYKAIALHVHSLYSDDVPPKEKNKPLNLIKRGQDSGLDYIVITDHDNNHAWQSVSEKPEEWLQGVEMEVNDERIGHPIHLGTHNFKSDDDFYTLHEIAHEQNDAYKYIETAKEKGMTIIANHPWWIPKGHRINPKAIWELIRYFKLPVELNSKRSCIENIATRIMAERYNLPIIAATDTHTASIGPACTLVKGDTIDEIFRNIEKGDTYYVAGSATPMSIASMITEYCLDVIHSEKMKEKGPINLQSGIKLIDHLLKKISQGYFEKYEALRYPAGILSSAITMLGSVLLYLPSAYINSGIKVGLGMQSIAK
ncbi:MAG: PHP-associated domain-containing protein [Candidatus Woesearchaeota archaeon]